MLITKEIKVKLNNKTKDHYLKLGYSLDNGFFNIKTEDLPPSSRLKVKSECDYCHSIKELPFFLYKKNISHNDKFACSSKCAALKRKEISLDIYGVESPSLLPEVREKVKKTNLEKYGTEYYFNTDDFKNKSKETNLEKYGNEIPMRNDIVKDKLKLSLLDKYGVDNSFKLLDTIKESIKKKYGVSHYSKTDEYKKKVKETNLEKYGVEHYSKTNDFIEKLKIQNNKKFGVDWYLSTDEFKLKSSTTNIEKYGDKSPMRNEFVKNKVVSTNLKKIGVKYPMMSDEVKNKSKQTNLTKYGVAYISQVEDFRKNQIITSDVDYIRYDVETKSSLFRCDKGHEFLIKSDNYLSRKKLNISICTTCFPIGNSISIAEQELFEFISSIYDGNIVQSYRDGLEIDIYIPDLKIGFEFNGLYWHSESYKGKNYHLKKLNYFKSKEIRVFFIWEDDWNLKKEIVKSMISNKIDVSINKIWARKCEVKEINDTKLVRDFLNKNHIQGQVGSKLKLGLFYNNELVSLMTFDNVEGRKKMKEGEWNINRFCSKLNTNLVGGASKILKYFIKQYEPKRIISYADRYWSDGDLYKKLGFIKLTDSNPDYKYIIDGKRLHKSNFKKSNLKIDENTTEDEFMRLNKIDKIYDCGKTKFEFII